MSWSEVLTALTFWNPGDPDTGAQALYDDYQIANDNLMGSWLSPEESIIEAILQDLYDRSDTAKGVLDRGAAQGSIFLFRSFNNSANSERGTNSIAIDLNSPTAKYFGFDGEIHTMSLQRLLIHELIHGIDGLADLVNPDNGIAYEDKDLRHYNHPDFDHQGLTVRWTNRVMEELNHPSSDGRAAYGAAWKPNEDGNPYARLDDTLDYAPWGDIDLVYGDKKNKTPQDLDTSQRTVASNDLLFGFLLDDWIRSGAGDDYLYGGAFNDTLFGGSGIDLLHGGDRTWDVSVDGHDTADYSQGDFRASTPGAITIRFDLSSGKVLDGYHPIWVSDDGYNDADYLYSIEHIKGTNLNDVVEVNGGDEVFDLSNYAISYGTLEIDGVEGEDILDFSGFSGSLDATKSTTGDIKVGDVTFKNFEIIHDTEVEGQIGEGTGFIRGAYRAISEDLKEIHGHGGDDVLVIGEDGEKIDGGSGEDWVVALGASNATLDGGSQDDVILSFGGQNNEIFGGAGDDTILSTTPGTRVHGGAGKDTFWFSNNTRIEDATPEETISVFGLFDLHGGYRHMESESPWAYGAWLFRYGLNQEGDLVIESAVGNQLGWGPTYVANAEVSPFVAKSARTAGILLFEYDMERVLLIENDTGKGMYEFFELVFGYMFKAMFGESYFAGVDPLVLDLDGDGLELTARTNLSPVFDLDGDGFAEQTGWVRPDDGLLVHDLNGNGQVDDITELFGSPTTSGFVELAQHDSNADGVIDAHDTIFEELRVWQDHDQDAQVDEGELSTLSELGIAELGLTATPSGQENSTNLVAETGSYTRTDGTTHELADVKFRINNYDSVWRGETAVDPAVAHLPNLKGHGTLTDLHVAMTLDTTGQLQTTVETVLPTLNTVDLPTLRARVFPVLEAWAAVPVDASAPAAPAKPDVHAFIHRTAENTEIVDFAIQTVEGHWALASGMPIRDANEVVIEEPTLADVLAVLPGDEGAWEVIPGAQIGFLERFMGEAIAIDRVEPGNDAAISAFEGLLELLVTRLDALAVRLAAQGPLQSYFAGVEYNVEADALQATTNRDLVPMFEAVFTGAPGTAEGDHAWLSDWNDILDVVFENFQRFGGDHLLNTFSFLFTNVVAAYENVGLAIDLKPAAVALGIPEDMVVVGDGEVVGNDQINLFYLGAGDQVVKGEGGHDVYVVGRDFGQDVIDDYEAPLAKNSEDMVRFAHYNPEDLTFTREGIDLVIRVNDTTNELRILEHFIGVKPHLFGGNVNPDRGINEIVFADGTVWRAFEIAEAVSHPSDADQTITGTWETDYLDGGAGNDILSGGDGGDVYFYDRGYGHDVAIDTMTYVLTPDPDFLVFGESLTPEDLTFSRVGDSTDIIITITDTGETLTLQGFAEATYTGPFGTQWFNRIEHLVFADGTYMQWEEVLEDVVAAQSTDGDDIIHGFSYEDVLQGGAGDDYLSGGNENDLYLFDIGDGHDTIQENMTRILSGQVDTLQFGAGVQMDQVTFSRNADGNDLVIGITPEDSVTILNQFAATYSGPFGTLWMERVEYFEFQVNGETVTLSALDVMAQVLAQASTDGDDVIYGFSREDVLDGGSGDDYLSGGNESDTYIFGLGYGHDTIEERQGNILSGDTDRVVFIDGLTLDDVDLVRDGDDLQFHLADGSMLTVTKMFAEHPIINLNPNRIEEFYFEGPDLVLSTWDIMTHFLDAAQTDGDDIVHGFRWNDRLDGGAGDDVLYGKEGNDTYVFGRGYGQDAIEDAGAGDLDVVEFHADVMPEDVRIERGATSEDVRLVITDTGDSLTIQDQQNRFKQIEEIRFADDTIWEPLFLQQQVILHEQTAGDDTIIGFTSADTFIGGAGDDRLEGREGGDTYVFNRGDGHDVVWDYNGSIFSDAPDTVQFGGTILLDDLLVSRSGDDLRLEIQDTGDTLTIEGQFAASYSSIERFVFSDGSVVEAVDLEVLTMQGSAAAETLMGTDREDHLEGHEGDDTLIGEGGSDRYVYHVGDGHDVIEEYADNGADRDQLVLEPGLLPVDVQVAQSATQSSDLVVTFQAGTGSVTLHRQLSGWGRGLEELVFADGTIWDRRELLAQAELLPNAMTGTGGDDTLNGTSGDDVLDGLAGQDVLRGYYGWDTYQFGVGMGNDEIDEYGGQADVDVVELLGLSTADVSLSRQAEDLVVTLLATNETVTIDEHFTSTGRGIEQIILTDAVWDRDAIAMALAQEGTTGDDTIHGTTTQDVVIGGLGDDVLSGGKGDDLYVYTRGDGDDTIHESYLAGEHDRVMLHGVQPGEVSLEREGIDLTLVIAESTPGAGDAGRIVLPSQLDEYYRRGVEAIIFDDGTVWDYAVLRQRVLEDASTDGDDILTGFNIDDVLTAGRGDDMLNGREGNDAYIYARGDGHDTIHEGAVDGDQDTLTFVDIASTEVELVRDGIDLTILIPETAQDPSTTGSIRLDQMLDDYHGRGVDVLQFADGVVWHREDLRQMMLDQVTTAGDDTIVGFNIADRLEGGAGDDTLQGGTGNDIYRYSRGDGHDLLLENSTVGGFDTLVFRDVNVADITLVRQGDDVTIEVAPSVAQGSDGGAIDIPFVFANSRYDKGIEAFTFADGTIWDLDGFREFYLTTAPTSGDDTIIGFLDRRDEIQGGAGQDVLDGQSGDDRLYGGAGDDHLIGGEGEDWLVGEDGNDLLIGGLGLDRFDGGAGIDTLDLQSQASGVTVNLGAETVWDGTALETAISIEQVWGSEYDDHLTGAAGTANVLSGRGGSDTYVYGEGQGHDVIQEDGTAGDVDIVELTDLAEGEVSARRSGQDLVLTVIATGETLTIAQQFVDQAYGVEGLVFADGTSWDREAISANVPFIGTEGDDLLVGTSVAETFDAQSGNDIQQGSGGSDTYRFGLGYGADEILDLGAEIDVDRVELMNLQPEGIRLGRSGEDLFIELLSSNETLRVVNHFQSKETGIEQLIFTDGQIWDRAMIEEQVVFVGTSGDDNEVGTVGDDTFLSNPGHDTMDGTDGSDTYYYARGDGHDQVADTGTAVGDMDALILTDLSLSDLMFVRTDEDLMITDSQTQQVLHVTGQFLQAGQGVERLVFADGTEWSRQEIETNVTVFDDAISGTPGSDTLTGTADADVLIGQGGDDSLHGRDGSDTYVFNPGDGQDVIDDNGWGDTDQLLIHGYAPEDITILRTGTSNTVVFTFAGTTDRITLMNQLNSTSDRIEEVIFDDGTVWTVADMQAHLLEANATEGDDMLIGFATDDTLVGGLGNDTIRGLDGSDTYVFTYGDGEDVIDDNGWRDTDQLLIHGYAPSAVSVERVGTSGTIVFTFAGTTDRLTLINEVNSASDTIEKIIFDDGTEWTEGGLRMRVLTEAGTAGADSIVGFATNDTLWGGFGDDTLSGKDGSDTYVFTRGDGRDIIDDGGWRDTDQLLLHGYTPDEVRLGSSTTAGAVVLNFAETTDQVTLVNALNNASDTIEEIVFDDGTVWLETELRTRVLDGTSGQDTLTGTVNGDRLTGLQSDDLLTGGAGNDTFVFRDGNTGHDTITDFSAGAGFADHLELDGFASFDDVLAAATDDGVDTTITLDAANSITLENVVVSELHHDDFQFV